MNEELFIRFLWLFISFGAFTLLFHTFKDFGSGTIDTRPNFLMKGIGFGLLIVSGIPLYYFLINYIVIFVFGKFLTIFKSGDYSTILWVSLIAYISPIAFALFIVAFLLQYAVVGFVRRGFGFFGILLSESFPAHLIILTSFVIMGLQLLG
jgi:hypothetical protein